MLVQALPQQLSPLCRQENAFNYDKGVLAEILEPIMGKGLIPADLETWKPRRRAIVPAFHKAYLEAMVQMFGRCTQHAVDKLDGLTQHGQVSYCPANPCVQRQMLPNSGSNSSPAAGLCFCAMLGTPVDHAKSFVRAAVPGVASCCDRDTVGLPSACSAVQTQRVHCRQPR